MGPYIGIDAVEIHRFTHMHQYRRHQLERIFTPAEIAYCEAHPALAAARYATRFAAKEAAYKALSQCITPPPFLDLARNIAVIEHPPQIYLPKDIPASGSVSLTHTRTTAVAVALICHSNY